MSRWAEQGLLWSEVAAEPAQELGVGTWAGAGALGAEGTRLVLALLSKLGNDF